MPKIMGQKTEGDPGTSSLVVNGRRASRKREFTITFQVMGDNINDTPFTIEATSGLPVLFQVIGGCTCKKIETERTSRIDNPMTGVMCDMWDVKCDFDSDVSNENAEAEDPTQYADIRRYLSERKEIPFIKDVITGNPITTRAGERIFSDKESSDRVIELRRIILPPFPLLDFSQYENTLNSGTFYGAPRGCVKLDPVEGQELYINGVLYLEITFITKFRMELNEAGTDFIEDTWQFRPLNAGFLYYKSNDPDDEDFFTPYTHTDPEGSSPTEVKLDMDGLILGDDEDPIYLNYSRYPYSDFSALNLEPA